MLKSSADQKWINYIDSEVRSICADGSWRHQIRRKWEVRAKPVRKSSIEDYEWKIIPTNTRDVSLDGDYEGTYYVLWLDKPNGKIVVQHDTFHCGIMGPHFERETFTTISIPDYPNLPSKGWLQEHLRYLISRFKPNEFSYT
ncbi:MAG: hypothetical protein GXP42_09165 [Chloroflexi bacterium]|nr:hypothetical protein [Chloroflexota bacterium]